MSGYPREIIDEYGHVHVLNVPPIGAGGQGIVFTTKHPNTAVKIVTDDSGNLLKSNQARTILYKQLEDVRILPLPELHLASPISVIQPPYTGYVMQLLTSMMPVKELIALPGENSLSEFYARTGSLRRRLVLLSKTAEILARLHAIPLVYADVSHNNIFVSKSSDAHEVWLIDADNLHFQNTKDITLHTPGFGAPEVVQGTSKVNTSTDVFAFAVLAFWVLAQIHPFLGDYVEEGGGWDDDEEDLEEKAFAGEIPWIEDEEDDINSTDKGIPRDIILTSRLRGLFQATFGPGRIDPSYRPSMQQWVDALQRATDWTITCPECKSSYYVSEECPWCDTPHSSFIYLEARIWDPDYEDNELAAVLSGSPFWVSSIDKTHHGIIHKHIIEPALYSDKDVPVIEVEFIRNGIKVTPKDDRDFWRIDTEKGTCIKLRSAKSISFEDIMTGIHLHCGSLTEPHSLVSLRYVKG